MQRKFRESPSSWRTIPASGETQIRRTSKQNWSVCSRRRGRMPTSRSDSENAKWKSVLEPKTIAYQVTSAKWKYAVGFNSGHGRPAQVTRPVQEDIKCFSADLSRILQTLTFAFRRERDRKMFRETCLQQENFGVILSTRNLSPRVRSDFYCISLWSRSKLLIDRKIDIFCSQYKKFWIALTFIRATIVQIQN